jgi:hypothetical protein
MNRLSSLFSYQCFERRVLLNLAALRAGLTAMLSALLLDWQASILGAALAVVLVPCNAALPAAISADWIERAFRMLAFGEVDNVNISARCELEGANTPTHREHEAEWRRRLRIPVWPDDPGSLVTNEPGLYPPPIEGFWNRVRALPSVLS